MQKGKVKQRMELDRSGHVVRSCSHSRDARPGDIAPGEWRPGPVMWAMLGLRLHLGVIASGYRKGAVLPPFELNIKQVIKKLADGSSRCF